MFNQTDFCKYALQTLRTDQPLEQQIQTLITKLQLKKPRIGEAEISKKLKNLQNQYNFKVALIGQVRAKLQLQKDSIEVRQSQEMAELLEAKRRYENMKELLKRKAQIYLLYSAIRNQKIDVLSELNDATLLQLTQDFQYIRQNNLFLLQNVLFKEIYDTYITLSLKTMNQQTLSQQLISILKQIPEILQIYLQINQNIEITQIGPILQNSTLLCPQQGQMNAQLKDYILKMVRNKHIQYNELVQLTNTLNQYLKSSISPQNSKEFKEFYVTTLLQTKYSQNNLSTIEMLLQNQPNSQQAIEAEVFVHIFIAIIEQSKDVYEQMNAAQLTGLLNRIKHVFNEIYNVFKWKITVASTMIIKNDPNHIKVLMTLQKMFHFEDKQKKEIILQLFDALILSFLLSDFRKIIQSLNGVQPDKLMQSRQLPLALQAAENIKTMYKNQRRIDDTLWVDIVGQKVIQLWEKAFGSEHCDLNVLRAAFDDANQPQVQQKENEGSV